MKIAVISLLKFSWANHFLITVNPFNASAVSLSMHFSAFERSPILDQDSWSVQRKCFLVDFQQKTNRQENWPKIFETKWNERTEWWKEKEIANTALFTVYTKSQVDWMLNICRRACVFFRSFRLISVWNVYCWHNDFFLHIQFSLLFVSTQKRGPIANGIQRFPV